MKPTKFCDFNCNIYFQHNYFLFIILFISPNFFICFTQNICRTEYSTIAGSMRIKWEAKESVHNQVVISNPPCYDDTNNLVIRTCSNGSWTPSTVQTCHPKFEAKQYCPVGYQRSDHVCQILTEPVAWQDSCSTAAPATISRKTQRKIEGEPYLWLPFKRTSKFGPFEDTSFGDRYGLPVYVNASSREEYFKNDCVTYRNKDHRWIIENCNHLHKKICSFDMRYSYYNCPKKSCEPGELGSKRCICKKPTSCRRYADINNLSDKFLMESLSRGEFCQIGNNFSIDPSQKNLNSFINGTDWVTGNYTTSCHLCEEMPIENATTQLILSFEEKFRKLYLVVYNFEYILESEHDYEIYCFTDASSQLKKKIEIKSVFERSDLDRISISVYKLKIEKYMGQYWCEAFELNTNKIVSNTIIAYKVKKGNEYALRLVMRNVCKNYDCGDFFRSEFQELADHVEQILSHFKSKVRVMEVFNYNFQDDFIDILFHVSTKRGEKLTVEYQKCRSAVVEKLPNSISLVYFRSSEACLPESTISNEIILHWPLTNISESAISDELCLSEQKIPAMRSCRGNFLYGAKWTPAHGNCAQNVTLPDETKQLRANLHTPKMETITKIIENRTQLSILDINYLSKILFNYYHENNSTKLEYFVQIIDHLLKNDVESLKGAQNLFNSTDAILNLFDDVFDDADFELKPFYLFQKQNLIVHITNPILSNISGLCLYGGDGDPLSELTVLNYYGNQSIPDLSAFDLNYLQLNVHLPDLHEITNSTTIITTIFSKDSLFIDSQYRSAGKVVSVSAPGFGAFLPSPLSIVYRSNDTNPEGCAFWDLGKTVNKKRGRWSTLGGSNPLLLNSSFYKCSYVHLSHFALLVMSDHEIFGNEDEIPVSLPPDNYDDFILNVITIVGGCLSALGIGGIFLTAVMFRNWRSKAGTKILLNLSVAILSETLAIHLAEIRSIKHSELGCKMVGMYLHYIVLSQFCWMLIYAFLQYYRFVKVIQTIPTNLILKSVMFGWGCPLVPVLICGLMTSSTNYNSSTYEFCYPRGWFLYLGVLLPICSIVIANFTIFCMIMYEVMSSKTESYGGNKDYKLQMRLGVLLFFVLGLPWTFGIIAELIGIFWLKFVLFYMFCITATLQGFILFVFYVILNKETRNYWAKLIRRRQQY